MSFLENAVNRMVDAMRWILRLEPASCCGAKAESVYRTRKHHGLSFQAVKVMTRSGAHERIRIVRHGQYFGAILDFRHPQFGWSEEHILCAGIVYDSPAAAEAEVRIALGGIRDWEEMEPVPTHEMSRS